MKTKTKNKETNKTVEDNCIEAIQNSQYQKDLTLLWRFGLELGAGREFKSHLDFGIFLSFLVFNFSFFQIEIQHSWLIFTHDHKSCYDLNNSLVGPIRNPV